jgi:hypothetical protein
MIGRKPDGQKMSDAEKARFDSFKEPTFTEFVHKFNKGGNGVDTNAEGELLPSVRMTDKSTWGKLWEAAGGEYTPEEREIFRNSDIPESEPAISRDMAQRIANSDKAGRQEILNKHLEGLNSKDSIPSMTNSPTQLMQPRLCPYVMKGRLWALAHLLGSAFSLGWPLISSLG